MGPQRDSAWSTARASVGLVIGLVAIWCCSLALATSSGDDATRSDLAGLVELLDSPDLATRENAATRLSRRGDFGIQSIERLMRDDRTLSAEQRMRLFSAGRDMYFRGPHAGMGISFGRGGQSGVQINSTVAGFDASRILRPNDVITSIGGQPISTRDQVSLEIISRGPGETMDLVIRRGDRDLDVSVVMGLYADLGNPPISPDRLEQAWHVRLARNGLEDLLGIEPALAPGADSLAGSFTMIVNQRSARARIRKDAKTIESWLVNATRGLTGGGTARGGVDRFEMPRTRIAIADASLLADDRTALALERDRNDEKLALAINALLVSQASLRQIEREYQNRIRRTADPDERAALAEAERSVMLAGRRLKEWYNTWVELENFGNLDD